MTKTARLTAKTPQGGMLLQKLFKDFPKWNGLWFILDSRKEHNGETGNWVLIAPIGHPWDKRERWLNAAAPKHFNVCFTR